MLFRVLLCWCAVHGLASGHETQLRGQALVDHINNLNTTWKARLYPGRRHFAQGLRWSASNGPPPAMPAAVRDSAYYTGDEEEPLPAAFDARDAWPHCESIGRIADQAQCGSCWAVAAATTISDRICIHSRQTAQVRVSAANVMECDPLGRGCDGGEAGSAYAFYVRHGLVSGGDYGDKTTCQPYPYTQGSKVVPQKCHTKCDNPGASSKLYKGQSFYQLPVDEKAIRREIFKNGPVAAGFAIYEDFKMYDGGIYQHKAGARGDGHAVRVIGWGREEGVDYWLVANSWNVTFGEAGLFRIVRGVDEAGFENDVFAVIPADSQFYDF